MRTLSKSKLLAFRQCPKQMWLEIYRPKLREQPASAQARFQVGHRVGEIARGLYDPGGKGQLIDAGKEGYEGACARTGALLKERQPIFEAGFSAGGALAFADVMLPRRKAGVRVWRMIEVKSTTTVKDYHREDVAIQASIAGDAGIALDSIALACIDNTWVYPGGEDYRGLLVEHDLSQESFGKAAEVRQWVAGAHQIADQATEPEARIGGHCAAPFDCGFLAHCRSQAPAVKYPASWIPRVQSQALRALIADGGVTDLRAIPDELLNEVQLLVKTRTLSGKVFFDKPGAIADLAPHKLPAYFIDFETIQFAVPIWKGRRPYQQIPYQFSVHRLGRMGSLDHQAFLDLSGKDPSRAFAEALLANCGVRGPVFVYNAGFEKTRIQELADRFPRLKRQLLAINERVVDLLPVAQARYYHPSQQGSWSIKKVLPAVAPDLRYEALSGVQNGGMATDAYLEAIDPGTSQERKEQIRQQLLDYCFLDTLALVRLWQFFSGRGNSASRPL